MDDLSSIQTIFSEPTYNQILDKDKIDQEQQRRQIQVNFKLIGGFAITTLSDEKFLPP